MLLYHGTTEQRAKMILRDGEIKNHVDRFYTEEEDRNSYTSQGYVYLSNEPFVSIHFGYLNSTKDGSSNIYLFRMQIADEMIESDGDEERMNDDDFIKESKLNSLHYSLQEYKSCRVPFSISLTGYDIDYAIISMKTIVNSNDLFKNYGRNYSYTISNYTEQQMELLKSLAWLHVAVS